MNTALSAAQLAQLLLTFYETHGWCQGGYCRNPDGTGEDWWDPEPVKKGLCFCLSGAMLRISSEGHWFWSPLTKFFDSKVPTYNDTPGRTLEEIRAKLREIAAEI